MGQIDPMKWDQAASDTIRAERAAARLSQSAVAEKAGLARSSFIRYETGERVPNVAHLAAIAQALDIPFVTFLRRMEDRARNL